MRHKDQAEKIALFRYGIIAPVLHDSTNGQTRYFKEMAQKVFDVPVLGRKTYSWKTFKSWLRDYRLAGFDGLYMYLLTYSLSVPEWVLHWYIPSHMTVLRVVMESQG